MKCCYKKKKKKNTHQKRSKAIQVLFGVPAGAKDPVLVVGASLVRQQNTSWDVLENFSRGVYK